MRSVRWTRICALSVAEVGYLYTHVPYSQEASLNEPRKDDCSCETKRRWKAFRVLLLLAGVSLVAYMPYKALVHYDKLQDIYGPWFIQGAVVAMAGVLFAVRPGAVLRSPVWMRLGVGLAALLWMRTGLACTPSLLSSIQASLPKGGFAMFHMLTQHVFLSAGVIAMVAAPRFFAEQLGATTEFDEAAVDTATGAVPS